MSAARLAPGLAGAGEAAVTGHCAAMAMTGNAAVTPANQVPCKGITPDCAKQLGCISSLALPTPGTAFGAPCASRRSAYWPPIAAPPGLSIKPGLFPPIAA